jgi:hypothetical protein
MIFALGTPHRGHTMPELVRFAMTFLLTPFKTAGFGRKIQEGCQRGGPTGLIVTCTAFRYFTGTPLSIAGRYRQAFAAFSAS